MDRTFNMLIPFITDLLGEYDKALKCIDLAFDLNDNLGREKSDMEEYASDIVSKCLENIDREGFRFLLLRIIEGSKTPYKYRQQVEPYLNHFSDENRLFLQNEFRIKRRSTRPFVAHEMVE